MNVNKSHMRAILAEEVGREMEKDLEASQIKVYKYQGAHEILNQAAKNLSASVEVTKNEIMDGKITFDPDDSMSIAKFVVRKIMEPVTELYKMAENSKMLGIIEDGKRTGLDHAVKKIKGIFDAEVKKLEDIKVALDAGTISIEDGVVEHKGEGPRLVGTHPGPSLRTIREQEEVLEQSEIAASKDNGAAKKPRRKGRAKSNAPNA